MNAASFVAGTRNLRSNDDGSNVWGFLHSRRLGRTRVCEAQRPDGLGEALSKLVCISHSPIHCLSWCTVPFFISQRLPYSYRNHPHHPHTPEPIPRVRYPILPPAVCFSRSYFAHEYLHHAFHSLLPCFCLLLLINPERQTLDSDRPKPRPHAYGTLARKSLLCDLQTVGWVMGVDVALRAGSVSLARGFAD